MANSDDFEILAGVIHRIVKPQFASEEDSYLDLRATLHRKNEHLNEFVENAEDITLPLKNENQTIAPTNRNSTNKYNHNFNEAGKILELMNYSLLNFKGSTAANAIRYSVIDNGTDNQIVFAPATYVLDLINTYNEGTYNLKDVFAKLGFSTAFFLLISSASTMKPVLLSP